MVPRRTQDSHDEDDHDRGLQRGLPVVFSSAIAIQGKSPGSARPNSRAIRSTARAYCLRRPSGVPPILAAISAQPVLLPRNSANARSSSVSRAWNSRSSSRPAAIRLGVSPPTPARMSLPKGSVRPDVAAAQPLVAGEHPELVPRHRCEQAQHVLGLVQVIGSGRNAEEEFGHDRLADVHRLEDRAQLGAVQTDPGADPPSDLRLELTDDLRGRVGVTRAYPLDQVGER